MEPANPCKNKRVILNDTYVYDGPRMHNSDISFVDTVDTIANNFRGKDNDNYNSYTSYNTYNPPNDDYYNQQYKILKKNL